MKNKKITIKFKAGQFGGDTSWWTKEDWDKHNSEVDKLKESGEYGKEFQRTFIVPHVPDFDGNPSTSFSEYGFLIPKGNLKDK